MVSHDLCITPVVSYQSVFTIKTMVLASTYFPIVKTKVSSALKRLTAEFGMESGVTASQ